MTKRTPLLAPVVAMLLITACGGGGGNNTAQAPASAPAIAPALPATEVNNAVADTPMSKPEVFRLLEQTTFGARLKDIDSLAGKGPEQWINQQMSMPATYLSDGLRASTHDRWNEYVNVWWRQAIYADDQLRQRVAFALSQIFVVSASSGLGDEQAALANYYDILMRHSFGNYRELIEEITLSPVMGEYLSMKGNHKPDVEKNLRPDENYARELLQLFSIGLSMLNEDGTTINDDGGVPLPTYEQETVEAFAHVFHFRWPKNKDWINPMVAWPEFHDSGEKTLLNGFVVPAGQSPEKDLSDALDNIANHPNVGPFIVKHLITKLVTSNPSPEYVRDVVQVYNRNAEGERGNLGSTIKAMLMHREAREGHELDPLKFGKTKEPLMRVSQLWRAFSPDSIHPDFNYGWVGDELQQSPLGAPSVFNFFTPDFSQPGRIKDNGLVSPEFEILDETSMISMTSRLLSNSLWSHNYKVANDDKRVAIDIDREMDMEDDRDALLDHLDLLLLGGRMSDDLRLEVNKLMDSRDYRNGASQRIAEAIFQIISSPEAAIHR